MAIHESDVPSAAIEAVRGTLTALAARPVFRTSNISRAELRALSLSVPHRVAFLPLANIKPQGSLRDAVRLGSWRFLVHEKRQVPESGVVHTEMRIPIATVTATFTGATYEFCDLNEGPFVQGTEQAIRQAEQLDTVRKGHFQSFFLLVPAVYVAALWLQDHAGEAGDIILTIPPSASALTPYEPITTPVLLSVLSSLATKVPPDDATAA